MMSVPSALTEFLVPPPAPHVIPDPRVDLYFRGSERKIFRQVAEPPWSVVLVHLGDSEGPSVTDPGFGEFVRTAEGRMDVHCTSEAALHYVREPDATLRIID